MKTKRLIHSVAVAVAIQLGMPGAGSANEDLQLWFPTQVIHPLTEDLTVSLQVELRMEDDISDFSELVVKPALNYHFNEHWALFGGYKYIDKGGGEPDEQDPWQEVAYSTTYGKLITKYQVRLEERFIHGIDGILPRIRFLTHVAHPIADTPFYLAGFGAVRFNLDDKGEGPVGGFEQIRLYAALGHQLSEHTEVELGYLWRYENKRFGPSLSDHAIHLQVVIHTDSQLGKKPLARRRYH